MGFHSNDARGATITVDPVTGEPAHRVTPLARAKGAEVGIRTVRIPRLQTTVTVWTLGLDSELVFVGDAGTTDAGRPSRRRASSGPTTTRRGRGSRSTPTSRSRARASPMTIPRVTSFPAPSRPSSRPARPSTRVRNVFGSVRWRYFGPRALVEDNSIGPRRRAW